MGPRPVDRTVEEVSTEYPTSKYRNNEDNDCFKKDTENFRVEQW